SPQVLAPAQVIAEEELLIALLRDVGLRQLAARLVPVERVADPVRAKLFKALVVERSADGGTVLERFPGDKDAQQTLLDLVDRQIRSEPGKLFDGAVRYFERKQKERRGEAMRAGFRKRLDAGDPEASLEFLRHYDRHHKSAGRDDDASHAEAP